MFYLGIVCINGDALKVVDFHVHPKWDFSYPLREVESAEVFAEKLVEYLDEQ